jgi:NDP-sugar pyrophosphorylase family protein
MLDEIEVLILCGGEGKRLRSVISDVPKPMAPIGTKPFLDYLIELVSRQGFKNFCFLTGYKSEKIFSYFQLNFKNLNTRFSEEETQLGTGGAIFQAIENSKFEKFLILNGDTFFNINLKSFVINSIEGTLKLALKNMADASRYGRVECDNTGQVISFIEKDLNNSCKVNLINGGIYLLDKKIKSYLMKNNGFFSIENDIFPKLLIDGKIFAQTFEDDFIDIGVPEDYIRAKTMIPIWLNEARYE